VSVLEDELYREIILDHYANPRNRGTMESPDVDVKGANPLCGDEIEVFLRLEDDRVAGVTFTGRGCSISQASASMMTEAIKGKTLGEVRAILDEFKTMMLGDAAAVDVEALGDLEALQGVKRYPVRVKCAVLAWNTLQEGLQQVEARENPRP